MSHEDPHRLPSWDPDAYDRQVIAERARAKAQQAKALPKIGPRATKHVAQPISNMPVAKPKLLRNGKWRAKARYEGHGYQATFDTKQEAQEFINQIKRGDI